LQPEGTAIISVPYRRKGGKNPGNPFHLYEPGETEIVNAFKKEFRDVEVFYQYYEEPWWLSVIRRMHMRRLCGFSEQYGRLSEGAPEELAKLRIGQKPCGMITNLLLIARSPLLCQSTPISTEE
jgi:hypothetical protein